MLQGWLSMGWFNVLCHSPVVRIYPLAYWPRLLVRVSTQNTHYLALVRVSIKGFLVKLC